MPPSVKFTKQEIIDAALRVVRAGGVGSLTARSLASELGASTRPMFTYFDSMDALKHEVHEAAKDLYRADVERGLAEPIPFRGVGQSYIRFAKQEPELYKLLFLEKPSDAGGGAMEALALSQDLVRASLMRIYRMDAEQADCYFRDLWLVAFSFATLIVTDDSPYTDEQMSAIFTEFSLAICKAYKEIPGLHRGDFDRDAIFRQLTSGGGTDGN
ncbi:MAG: TetR/AcrR family transcriptional regulator [Atopobiaceae bacterium]|nr:TetR/AcrR family transcriptional regulator [Atopobiaceae bacterium]